MTTLAKHLACQRALDTGPKTLRELTEASGMTYESMAKHVSRLREMEAVHISEWREGADGRFTIMVIAKGPGIDAVRPTPKTAAERMRATRARRAA